MFSVALDLHAQLIRTVLVHAHKQTLKCMARVRDLARVKKMTHVDL